MLAKNQQADLEHRPRSTFSEMMLGWTEEEMKLVDECSKVPIQSIRAEQSQTRCMLQIATPDIAQTFCDKLLAGLNPQMLVDPSIATSKEKREALIAEVFARCEQAHPEYGHVERGLSSIGWMAPLEFATSACQLQVSSAKEKNMPIVPMATDLVALSESSDKTVKPNS